MMADETETFSIDTVSNMTIFNESVTINSTLPNFTHNADAKWTAPDFNVTPSNVLIAISLTAVVIVTSFGNLIVLIAFVVDTKLWQPFNLYIMNLAVTDFLVGFVAMSFYSIDTLLGYWPFGQVRICLRCYEIFFRIAVQGL